MHQKIVETPESNGCLTPHASACMSFAVSFANEDFFSRCGTLLDTSDVPSVHELKKSNKSRYEEIDSLIGEILFLVDLLFVDHGVMRMLPEEAA